MNTRSHIIWAYFDPVLTVCFAYSLHESIYSIRDGQIYCKCVPLYISLTIHQNMHGCMFTYDATRSVYTRIEDNNPKEFQYHIYTCNKRITIAVHGQICPHPWALTMQHCNILTWFPPWKSPKLATRTLNFVSYTKPPSRLAPQTTTSPTILQTQTDVTINVGLHWRRPTGSLGTGAQACWKIPNKGRIHSMMQSHMQSNSLRLTRVHVYIL